MTLYEALRLLLALLPDEEPMRTEILAHVEPLTNRLGLDANAASLGQLSRHEIVQVALEQDQPQAVIARLEILDEHELRYLADRLSGNEAMLDVYHVVLAQLVRDHVANHLSNRT